MGARGWRSRIRRSARDPGSFLLTYEAIGCVYIALELLVGWLVPTAFLLWSDLPWPVQAAGSLTLFVGTLVLARFIQRWNAARRYRDPPTRAAPKRRSGPRAPGAGGGT